MHTKKVALFSMMLLLVAACILIFSGCNASKPKEPIEISSIKLNTAISIKIYDSDDRSLLEECLKLCDHYEKIFSRTSKDSELYKLNHRVSGSNEQIPVSPELSELIAIGLDYSDKSHGSFDISIAPLSSLWNFTAEDPSVPSSDEIQTALYHCGYQNISFSDDSAISFSSSEIQIDLGGIAKGYIADRIKDYLVSRGVKSAIINLGGNVLCIGNKPDGQPFQIGIQKPFADRNETAAIMEIRDKSVVSSGIYERYFKKEDTLYHHILNPKTGYPYDNDLVSVTIISDTSVDGDAFSTLCFSMGLEKGLKYAESLENIDAVFIDKNYSLHYTSKFHDHIKVK